MSELADRLAGWRRDFHAHPELGFMEYRTAARICEILSALPGCRIRFGEDAMSAIDRYGAPTSEAGEAARAEALAAGANPMWVRACGDGLTGVVAEWKFDRPGPTVAFRVDMDALLITECATNEHLPARKGFASRRSGRMHACGHDGHTAIGLGLASLVAERSAFWGGQLRIIFQPAEEGCRGAAAMVAAGATAGVDYLIAGHLGATADETGLISCGTTGILASTKFDVVLLGCSAHAGMKPHEGKNALLAAATLVLQLHAISRHGEGDSRVNVGRLISGNGRNVIADRAELQFEVRGGTAAINDFMADEAERIIAAVAAMYRVRVDVRKVGASQSGRSDAPLMAVVRAVAEALPQTRRVVDSLPMPGSEDATFFMSDVQARGGQATYLLIGATLAQGHHHSAFDFDEASLLHGVELYTGIADRLLSVAPPSPSKR